MPSDLGKQETYTFITQKGALARGKNITHSHKNTHISYPTTVLFQCDGWLKPNKVIFRDEPQPSGLFIRYVKLDPTGLSSSCLNMHIVLMKSTMLLMCFKCSLLDPCLYNNLALLPLTTEVFNGPPADTGATQWTLSPVLSPKGRWVHAVDQIQIALDFHQLQWSYFHSKY